MSYRNDQFFNIRGQGEFGPTDSINGDAPGEIKWLNDRFVYPSREIIVAQPGRKELPGKPEVLRMKRGYIRQVNEFGIEGLDDTTSLACRFQFNPQYLSQSVQFSMGATHPMYQHPAQLNQPTAIPTNIAIQVMFDRSYEMNGDNRGNEVATGGDLWERNSPRYIGVFHDLSALFRVIGQGISEETFRNQIVRATESLNADVIEPGRTDISDEETTVINERTSNLERFFGGDASSNPNIGNTAFLIPLPIRFVLSSLYMLEGFVTGTDVQFLKFNRAYVPMQCVVSLSVNALYVGYAKRKTFFSVVLQDSATRRRLDLQVRREQIQDAIAIGRQFANTASVVLVRSVVRQFATDPTGDIPDLLKLLPGPSGDAIATIKSIAADPPITPLSQGRPARYSPLFVTGWFNGWNKPSPDGIADAFESGELTRLRLSLKAVLYGPYDGTPRVSSGSGEESVKNDDVIKAAPDYESDAYVVTISNKTQWEEQYSKGVVTGSQNSGINITQDEVLNYAKRLPRRNQILVPAGSDSKKWSVLYLASLSVTYNGVEINVSGDVWQEYSGDSDRELRLNIPLNWSSLPVPEVPGGTSQSTDPNNPFRLPLPGAIPDIIL
jgi:predicted transport protein